MPLSVNNVLGLIRIRHRLWRFPLSTAETATNGA
eukprot:COSAG02_NODE_2445_length_8843_cov_21.333143_6_plen_34_part_00